MDPGSLQPFICFSTEEEKEERMTMSVISSEETKSPPNGDRHEASSAPAASPPNLGWYRDVVYNCLINNSFRKLEEEKTDVCY